MASEVEVEDVDVDVTTIFGAIKYYILLYFSTKPVNPVGIDTSRYTIAGCIFICIRIWAAYTLSLDSDSKIDRWFRRILICLLMADVVIFLLKRGIIGWKWLGVCISIIHHIAILSILYILYRSYMYGDVSIGTRNLALMGTILLL